MPKGWPSFHPQGELPQDFQERFALDHDHPAHLEGQGGSPFNRWSDTSRGYRHGDGTAAHEHPPWTATSRAWRCPCDRLAMLEPVYRLAPGPADKRQGQAARPRMTRPPPGTPG